MRLSDNVKNELWRRRARGGRHYQIARKAKLNAGVLSAMLNDAIVLKPTDPRVFRLARVLGLKREDCFAPEAE